MGYHRPFTDIRADTPLVCINATVSIIIMTRILDRFCPRVMMADWFDDLQ